MVELVRGIKAGIVAGIIYGVFYALFFWIFPILVASLLGIPTTPSPFGGRYVKLRVHPFAGLIIGPIFGIILGIIYAFTYDRLPGRKLLTWKDSEVKGAILALVVWVILFLIAIPTRISISLSFSELEEYRVFQIIMTLFALWFFIILGQQLGYFWDKFKPKEPKATST